MNKLTHLSHRRIYHASLRRAEEEMMKKRVEVVRIIDQIEKEIKIEKIITNAPKDSFIPLSDLITTRPREILFGPDGFPVQTEIKRVL